MKNTLKTPFRITLGTLFVTTLIMILTASTVTPSNHVTQNVTSKMTSKINLVEPIEMVSNNVIQKMKPPDSLGSERTPKYYDVPLSHETQQLLFEVCDAYELEYELVLAVIWNETRFNNVMGDNGNSYGYMQIQPKWHKERMTKLGVIDLLDPYSNFTVGCDLLSELINKYGVEGGLTAYNTGRPGSSAYATRILNKMDEYKRG